MNRPSLFVAVALMFVAWSWALGQASSPAERKAFREYTSPQELVSIAPSTTLDKALTAISEVSQKFIGKVIVDTEHRSMPINVDIQGMQWRDALDAICHKNDLWYAEYENYIQLTGGTSTEGAAGATKQGAAPAQGGVINTDVQKEYATFRSREIKISAVFFEVNLTRLEEFGIDWSFMKSTSSVDVTAESQFAGEVSKQIFKTEVTPKVSFANMNFLARVFSNYGFGEVLSGPQIIVRSGEQGRIQVGQDFSVRERDFAGNLIDKFYSAGTIIKVTPQVIAEQGVNFIRLKAEAEKSDVVPGAITTIINKTTAATDLLLLDGEESIVGGLYSSETDEVRSGVPVLKDLPWYVFGLRYVFGYQNEKTVKRELVILLKAELVPTLQERITQKAKPDGIFERWLEGKMKEEHHMKGSLD